MSNTEIVNPDFTELRPYFEKTMFAKEMRELEEWHFIRYAMERDPLWFTWKNLRGIYAYEKEWAGPNGTVKKECIHNYDQCNISYFNEHYWDGKPDIKSFKEINDTGMVVCYHSDPYAVNHEFDLGIYGKRSVELGVVNRANFVHTS